MSTLEAGLESLVVTGVVARVVVALLPWQELVFEAGGLVLLTSVAVVLEFVYGRNPFLRHLKPRPSFSSGLLLGAVTLPLVQVARLVQLLRCSTSAGSLKISPVEVDRLRFEFWLALSCSTSMLMLLMSVFWKQSLCSWICSTLFEYTSVFMIFFVLSKQNLETTWLGLWSTVYVLGGKSLFSCLLQLFPSSGTLGEVMLVVEGVVLYGANAATSALAKVPWLSVKTAGHIDLDEHLISAIVQGVVLGILLIPFVSNLLYKSILVVLRRAQHFSFVQNKSREDLHTVCQAGLFYLVLLVVILSAVPRWSEVAFGIQLNPVMWALEFMSRQPVKRLLLCSYWVGVICTPLSYLYRISTSGQVPQILVRKYYHVMVVLMFTPALLFDPRFLELAFGVALSGFLVIEIIRVWRFPPFGYLVQEFMSAFTDQRDSGLLIVSHFSLLLGCALPVWLNSGLGDRPLASFAGILSLGIGDTMASVIGFNFGSIRVTAKSKKTLEGTLAGIVSVLAACLLLIPLLPPSRQPAVAQEYASLAVASIISGVLEAYTLQLDNAFVPLLFYSLLCL